MKNKNTLTKVFLAISLLLLLSLTGCDPDNLKKEPETEGSTGDAINTALLLQLVNNKRTSGCNCGTEYFAPTNQLTWNTKLTLAAYDHSSDMNKKNFFDHTGSDGSDSGVRIERRGYQWKACGENIAKGYTSEQSVINGWLESPGHCRNIMNPVFKEMGVSKVGPYWTQVFAAPK